MNYNSRCDDVSNFNKDDNDDRSSSSLLKFRHRADRKAGISRQHGGSTNGPPETSQKSQPNGTEGVKGRPSPATLHQNQKSGQKKNVFLTRREKRRSLPWESRHRYTRRNYFGILLNQPEIRLYLPCTD